MHMHLTNTSTYWVHLHHDTAEVTESAHASNKNYNTHTYRVHLHLSHDTAEVWVQLHLLAVLVHGVVRLSVARFLIHQRVDVRHVVVKLAGGDDGSVGDLHT